MWLLAGALFSFCVKRNAAANNYIMLKLNLEWELHCFSNTSPRP